MNLNLYNKWLKTATTCLAELSSPESQEHFDEAVQHIVCTRTYQNRIWFIGNGASATMASHFACDFTKGSDGQLKAGVFTDPALITALTNDLADPDDWMAEALRMHTKRHDLLIAISSSGSSANVLRAVEMARKLSLNVITFSGFSADNPLRISGNVNFWVNSSVYNIVESIHTLMLGLLTDLVLEEINNT